MRDRRLGSTDVRISAICLACMGMSEFYGSTDKRQSVNTIGRALDLGLNYLDTADMYGTGLNYPVRRAAAKDLLEAVSGTNSLTLGRLCLGAGRRRMRRWPRCGPRRRHGPRA